MSTILTHDQFLEQLNAINRKHIGRGLPEIFLKKGSFYEAKNAPLKFYCYFNDEKITWTSNPSKILSGHHSKTIVFALRNEKTSKTHHQFLLDLRKTNAIHKEQGLPKIYVEKGHKYKNGTEKLEFYIYKNGVKYSWLAQPRHITNSLSHCPALNDSKRVLLVEKYLKDNNIEYLKEKRFKDCLKHKPLPFDFYLPEYNLVIEVDGSHHFHVINFHKTEQRNEEKFEERKENDEIKNKYCKESGMNLLRIPYCTMNHCRHDQQHYISEEESIERIKEKINEVKKKMNEEMKKEMKNIFTIKIKNGSANLQLNNRGL
jgi:very-short-patch-repair endonuclease